MYIALEVSNPVTSRLVKLEHPPNMRLMYVTLEVLNPLKIRLSNFSQPLNMHDMSVILLVFKFSKPSICVRFVKPSNQ